MISDFSHVWNAGFRHCQDLCALAHALALPVVLSLAADLREVIGGLNNYLRDPLRVPFQGVYKDYYKGYYGIWYRGLNNYQYYFGGS